MHKRSILAIAAGAAFIAAPAFSQTTLTLSSWVPPNHSLTLAQSEWCEIVSKNSGGKIKCNLLPRAVAAPPGTFPTSADGQSDPNRFGGATSAFA